VNELRRVYGVDFSGARDAGRKIWIASGHIEGDGLLIDDCVRGEDLPSSSRDRAHCLSVLRGFIAGSGEAIFGLDFPFGLPRAVIIDDRWEDFARSFSKRYATAQQFRRACFNAAHGRELKRVTDVESKTPFSPYNLRLYRQTFYGLRDLIGPLLADRVVCVLPMQRARSNVPWLIEICPASTLKQLSLYVAYKGRTADHRAARSNIVRLIQRQTPLKLSAPVRSVVIDDADGDALDSVIAALATFRMLRGRDRWPASAARIYRREGYVFV
jgi:hypothetical protein